MRGSRSPFGDGPLSKGCLKEKKPLLHERRRKLPERDQRALLEETTAYSCSYQKKTTTQLEGDTTLGGILQKRHRKLADSELLKGPCLTRGL